MTDEIDDGGPAFPVTDGGTSLAAGMTLRDYLAAHAPCDDRGALLQAIKSMGDGELLGILGMDPHTPAPTDGFMSYNIWRATLEARLRARLRFIEADAMLIERKLKGGIPCKS